MGLRSGEKTTTQRGRGNGIGDRQRGTNDAVRASFRWVADRPTQTHRLETLGRGWLRRTSVQHWERMNNSSNKPMRWQAATVHTALVSVVGEDLDPHSVAPLCPVCALWDEANTKHSRPWLLVARRIGTGRKHQHRQHRRHLFWRLSGTNKSTSSRMLGKAPWIGNWEFTRGCKFVSCGRHEVAGRGET